MLLEAEMLRWMDGFSYALLSRWRRANSEWRKQTTCLPRKAKCSYLPFLTLTARQIIARQRRWQQHQAHRHWQVRVASYRAHFETAIEDTPSPTPSVEESRSSVERFAAISPFAALCLPMVCACQLCNFTALFHSLPQPVLFSSTSSYSSSNFDKLWTGHW